MHLQANFGVSVFFFKIITQHDIHFFLKTEIKIMNTILYV